MKLVTTLTAAIAAVATSSFAALALDISGAGATFPYPIYAKWADAYKKETGNGLNYQSIGSGGGIKQINARTVTFGASDMPLKAEDLSKGGLVQFPTVMGGVMPVVNLEGVKPGDLTLDGATLAKIFLGDSGSLLAGFLLAVTAITGKQKGATSLAVGVPLLIFALPIADTFFTVARRLLAARRYGVTGVTRLEPIAEVLRADRLHIHHRLLDLGLSHRDTVLAIYAICAFLGIVAMLLSEVTQLYAFLGFFVLSGLVLFGPTRGAFRRPEELEAESYEPER